MHTPFALVLGLTGLLCLLSGILVGVTWRRFDREERERDGAAADAEHGFSLDF